MLQKKLLFVICLLFVLGLSQYTLNAQGVAINLIGDPPNASAMLDVSASNKGMLVPRVDITDLSTEAPITSPAVSLLVYNINTTTGVGYYYWTGTEWIKLATAGNLDYVDGSGVATRVAFWSGTNSLSSNQNLFWDNDNNSLGIGTTSPNAKIDIKDPADTGIMLYLTDDNNNTGEVEHKAIQIQTQTNVQSWVATNGDAFFNGKLGIGISAPAEKLVVNGKATSGALNDILFVDGIFYTNIQDAINDLPASGGKIILPAGTYTISSQINLSDLSNITIEGVGRATKIVPTSAMSVVQLYQANNIIIKNIYFDCNDNSSYGMRCVNMEGASNCIITECWINESNYAIYLKDNGATYPCENNLISNNIITNCKTGIYTDATYATSASASLNRFNKIVNNSMDMNNLASSYGIDINSYCASYIISGNTIKNVGSHGIDITYSYGIIVNSNIVMQAGTNGIHFQGGTGLVITSNIIQDTGQQGVSGLLSKNVTFCNNVSIGANHTNGFYMYSGTKGTAVGNTTDKASSFGSGFVEGYNQ